MSSICVLVTVPTESEESRLYSCSCACGRIFLKRHVVPVHMKSTELCEHCWRQAQADHSDTLCQYAGFGVAKPQLSNTTLATMLGQTITVTSHTDNSQTAENAESTTSSKRARQRCRHNRVLNLGLSSNAPLELVVRTAAGQLQLSDAFWCLDVTGCKLQARFDMQLNERYESLLSTLQEWGIGEREGTHVVAINCLDTRSYPHKLVEGGAESAWQGFMDSVRCRLNVNQVVRQVSRDASITFDFVVLLIAATLLSCVGLVEDSFLFLSSSMLISPLMGPIIAGIFGTVIGDCRLRWLGIKNELFGIAIAVLIGLLFGVLVLACGMCRFFVISKGLTEEILSRVDTHSLSIGVLTALASGAAGAIGVLGGNTGSLVGVAISASLLPPAVNSGLLWALAVGTQFMDPNDVLLQNLSKHQLYSSRLPLELLVCAAISIALTLVNVVCVWLMGVVVLRIKEVAPAVRRNHQFWRHDVKVARECAQHDPELKSAIEQLDHNERAESNELSLDDHMYQHSWSPGSMKPTVELPSAVVSNELNNYHTVHGFQEFCVTLHKLNSVKVDPPELELPIPQCTLMPQATTLTDLFKEASIIRSAADQPQGSSLGIFSGESSHGSLSDALPDWSKHVGRSSLVSLHANTVKSQFKHKRSVHWSELQKPSEQSPMQSIEEDDCLTGVATTKGALPTALSTCKRNAGQVLLPLPLPSTMPNRTMQLMSSHEQQQQPATSIPISSSATLQTAAAPCSGNDEYFA